MDLTRAEEPTRKISPDTAPTQQIAPGTSFPTPQGEFKGYTILGPIGQKGGESNTFLAEKDGQKFVIKFYWPEVRPDREVLWELRNQKEAGKYFVRLYDCGDIPERNPFYEILEYISGGSLNDLKRRLSDFTERREVFREVIRQVAEALHALHERDIIHRDLKPANILIRQENPLELVLIDFGISRKLKQDVKQHLTTHYKGTISYSAPEEFSGSIGKEVDWWHLGIIGYEILVGKHPFEGLSDQVINKKLLSEEIEVPMQVEGRERRLLLGLLTRDPKQRWGYAAIQKWLQGDDTIPVHRPDTFVSTRPSHTYTMQDWLSAGFTEQSYKHWEALGLSPQDARSFQKFFSLHNAKPWIEVGFRNGESAYEWKAAGFEPEEVRVYDSFALNVQDALKLKEDGFTALLLSPYRGELQIISKIHEIKNALSDINPRPEDVMAIIKDGIPLDDARNWIKNYRGIKEYYLFRQKGIIMQQNELIFADGELEIEDGVEFPVPLRLRHAKATLKNVTLNGLYIEENSEVHIADCTFKPTYVGIEIRSSKVEIKNTQINPATSTPAGPQEVTIKVIANSEVHVQESTISIGIEVEGSKLSLVGVQFAQGAYLSVRQATIEINNLEVNSSKWPALLVEASSQLSVIDMRCQNVSEALRLIDSQASLTNLSVAGGERALFLQNASVTLQNTHIEGLTGEAIVLKNSSLTGKDIKLVRNEKGAILGKASSLTFENVEALHNGGQAQIALEGGSLQAQNLTLNGMPERQNRGLWGSHKATLTLTACKITNHGKSGITLESSTLNLNQCELTGNKGSQVYAKESSVSAKECQVKNASGDGFQLWGSSASLEKVRVESHQRRGLYAERGGSLSLSGCQFVKNGALGDYCWNCQVALYEMGEVRLTDTSVTEGPAGGLALIGVTTTLLERVRVEGHQGSGLYARGGQSLSLSGCQFLKNGVGVRFEGAYSSNPLVCTFEHCDISDNAEEGIIVEEEEYEEEGYEEEEYEEEKYEEEEYEEEEYEEYYHVVLTAENSKVHRNGRKGEAQVVVRGQATLKSVEVLDGPKGGILVYWSGSLTLENCRIENNQGYDLKEYSNSKVRISNTIIGRRGRW